ncbi:MAG: TonB C-terminal domain-containing protein [Bdellovibrionota bacterium]
MDFKFDIRILALSLLLHLAGYVALSIYTQKHSAERFDAIEVVIEDSSQHRRQAPAVKKSDDKKEETKSSRFFSEEKQQFEKETIARNFGATNNQKIVGQKEADKEKSIEVGNSPNFMPIPKQGQAQEERQSTVNFSVPNLEKGDFTFLNSDFSTYASFYNRITPKIVYNWGNNIEDVAMFPHMREKLRQKLRWITRVELIINKKGDVKDVVIMHSSGSTELDQAIHEALMDAGPYLNPPTGMVEKDGLIHILGEFTVYTQRPHFAKPY